MKHSHRLINIAPMMGYSDLPFRMLMSLLVPNAALYTPMFVDQAVIHGGVKFNKEVSHKPVILQLGGGNQSLLAEATKRIPENLYSGINLNVGCPSQRVQHANIGACLMKNPEHVATLYQSMQSSTTLPVSIKCRIGVDDHASYSDLKSFVDTVASAGCRSFVVHARAAWLQGVNPKQNRDVPPLNYKAVYELKRAIPGLEIVINGGIVTYDGFRQHLSQVDGVMVGRLAIDDPYALHTIACKIDEVETVSRYELLVQYMQLLEEGLSPKEKTGAMRHVVNIFSGLPHSRKWRQMIASRSSWEDLLDFARRFFTSC